MLNSLPEPVFDTAEARIYADSTAVGSSPSVPEGYLCEIVKTDPMTDQRMIEFHGSPRVWMDQFSGNPRRAKFILDGRNRWGD